MAQMKPVFNTAPYVERNVRIFINDVNALAVYVNTNDAKDLEKFNSVLDRLDAIRAGTAEIVDIDKLINAKAIETNYSNAELHKAKFYIKTWPITPDEYHLQRSAKILIMRCFKLLNLPQVREDIRNGVKVFSFSVDEVTHQEAANCFNNNKTILLDYEVLPNKEAKSSTPKEKEDKLRQILAQRQATQNRIKR